MGNRQWKLFSVVLILLIAGSFVFVQGFHYKVSEGFTYRQDGSENGTLIIIESLPNVAVNINATFSFTGAANGPGTIILEDGNSYVVNSSHPNVYISGSISGEWFRASTEGSFKFGQNLSSNTDPLAIGVVFNYPFSDFNSQDLQTGTGHFAIFVFNYTEFQIRAVAMPL